MSEALKGNSATILVVDDNPAVLQVVVAILESADYRVLFARSGSDAIKMAAETAERIDLLLSDIDMPLMSGPELGQILKKARPDLLVMLMSGGGADGSLLVLNYGWAFITKPFVLQKLLHMVFNVLHAPDRSQLGDEFDSRKDKSDGV